jgi:hypothetical protein
MKVDIQARNIKSTFKPGDFSFLKKLVVIIYGLIGLYSKSKPYPRGKKMNPQKIPSFSRRDLD